jgi:hypothetical protein
MFVCKHICADAHAWCTRAAGTAGQPALEGAVTYIWISCNHTMMMMLSAPVWWCCLLLDHVHDLIWCVVRLAIPGLQARHKKHGSCYL